MSPYLPGAALITESMITKLNQDIQVSFQATQLLRADFKDTIEILKSDS